MLLKLAYIIILGLFTIPCGLCVSTTNADHCFDAQVQEGYFNLIGNEHIFNFMKIKTTKDTAAVQQKFHIDYFHPKTQKWTSYQENRRTLLFTLPSHLEIVTIKFADPFVAKSVRISLKRSDAVSWLGEICVRLMLDVKYLQVSELGKSICEKGYYGDGKFCLDVNECADNTGNFCLPQQQCIDIPGSYSCPSTCLENKLPNPKTGTCENHCFHRGYLCHANARCLYGKCVCNSGFEGDGSYCLDSCIAKGFSCDSNANCANGVCKCREGYRGNGEICQAICHFNLKLCHPDAICHFNACQCKPGYVGDGITKCAFSRKLYEKAMKKKKNVKTQMQIVETDVLEVLHTFQRLRSVVNPRG